MELKYIAKEKDENRTVKSILKSELGLSERLIKKLKNTNGIFLNSLPVYVVSRVQPGDLVHVSIELEEKCEDIIPENIHIDIIFEDEHMIILNKQPGIVVHPTVSHPSGTIANAVMYHLSEMGKNLKVRPVSRLDRDTSGVIIFAKNPYVQTSLVRQMASNTFIKEYLGIVWGVPDKMEGTIDMPIERKPDTIMLRHVSETGKPSVTHYEVLKTFDNAALLKFVLETGRTHQIRVHCQATGHPIIGDTLYFQEHISEIIARQALHSYKVSFIHPVTAKPMEVFASLPDDMRRALEILENKHV
ncbi:MAG TPA: RluA family pseudouridine synthase [Clostridiales bacterium]|nr:RluA family pseudouridine synthase [Clostridiales bacterium]